jgi:hypothetical protein
MNAIQRMALAAAIGSLASGCPGGSGEVECGPPIASAGEDQTAVTGSLVVLRGAVRLTPEDEPRCQQQQDAVRLQWEQISGPQVELSGAEQLQASFVPDTAGSYGFRCKAVFAAAADPARRESQWDRVQVEVAERVCGPPVADAGDDQLLAIEAEPVVVRLDGRRSQPAAACADLELVAYDWSLIEQPDGSAAGITPGAEPGLASFEAALPGDYRIELEVRDSLGGHDRDDSDRDSLLVQVIERTPCDETLEVHVMAAADASPLSQATVSVVDAAGAVHSGTSDADGLVVLDGLAPGRRRSISAWSDQTVAPLPGSAAGGQRPRYQAVSVLDHCSGRLTLPLPLSDSGRAARERGVVTAKVPEALFDVLPHSNKLAGACRDDDDCRAGTSCRETPLGDRQCTPDSLLPVFSIDDPHISGQFRGAVLLPVLAGGDPNRIALADLLAPPPTERAFLPGNLASDDSFLNGLGGGLGLDVWGADCSTVADCPDVDHYTCEQDPDGRRRCRDLTPLHNLRLEVAAGDAVGLVLLLAVVDVNMANLLPILSQFLSAGSGELEFDVGSLLGAFQIHTLHACLLRLPVTANRENDISAELARLALADCWSVEAEQQEVIEPVPDPSAVRPDNTCQSDADCGWPDQNLRCLAATADAPDERYCFIPLYRVRLLSEQRAELQPAAAPDPTAAGFDQRLCAWLPEQASHPRLCPAASGPPRACDPPQQCELAPPAETACGLPYGMAALVADLPVGHARLPAGGRLVLGFQFNISPASSDTRPQFLLPAFASLGAERLSMVQRTFRNVVWLDDGTYASLPGAVSAVQTARGDVRRFDLAAYRPWPALPAAQDAGLQVRLSFEPVDPTAACDQMEYRRVTANARRLLQPQAGSHDLGAAVTLAGAPAGGLAGLELARVERNDPAGDGDVEAVVDRLWRIYHPAAAESIALPAAADPFAPGQEVWLTPFSAGFSVPYDHDLLPPALIRERAVSRASDSYALIVAE